MSIEELKQLDGLVTHEEGGRRFCVHREHRWDVPIIRQAQLDRLVPSPCTLVMFDMHHDSRNVVCSEKLKQIRADGCQDEAMIELCQDRQALSHNNDDWIKALMELGLIDNAVIFGVGSEEMYERKRVELYRDHTGGLHHIIILCLPNALLCHQGSLCDEVREQQLKPIWTALGWGHLQRGGLGFIVDERRYVLDFDLDLFVIRYLDYEWPWCSEVFKGEFLKESVNHWVLGWSGKKLIEEILKRSGLVTISREPDWCGGDEKAEIILRRLNKYLLGGRLDKLLGT